ncbi:hypothetical protein ACQKNX_24450 [Lysinibacillus sp. NPDC093712]|uniref:hypothetical protein n=1 Tax=Lysinibacillus sp. NPDC093712 TaxID=3390579 RepID=UPI003D044E18
MAKLMNVKTVDMVNGEITKVAYDGAEYAKVDSAEAGDLALCTGDVTYFTKGEFYEVTEVDSDGDIHAIDDEGDRFHMYVADGECAVFRKISAPTLEERVSSLESDVASLKGEKVETEKPFAIKEGDEVTVNFAVWKKHGILDDLTEGKRYKVIKRRDGLNIIDDVGDERNLFVDEPEVVNVVKSQANETIEFEGVQYRKVDREAREGDVVILTKYSEYNYTEGKSYLVQKYGRIKDIDGDLFAVYNESLGRTRKTVDVYEAQYILQVGDIVVVTGNTNGSDNDVGDIGKITEVDESASDARVHVVGRADYVNWTYFSEMRKATPAEVEAYEKAAHKASFAVGDYVKIVKSYRGLEGSIAKITEIGEYPSDAGVTCEFEIEHLTGKYAGQTLVADADQIVKATDAEIAKATAPKLKVGDYVKFKRSIADTQAGKPYLIETKPSGGYLAFKDDSGDWCSIERTGGYEIVDAETAKWAKIGRKVGEIRKGDVVKVISDEGRHAIGTVGIARCDGNTGSTAVIANGISQGTWSSVKLIAPVESTVAQ